MKKLKDEKLLEQEHRNRVFLLRVADRGYVIENGRIALEETSEGLLQNEDVIRAYLGKDYRKVLD